MKQTLKIVSFVGLGLTILPSIFVFKGIIHMNTHLTLMAVGMVLWFCTAPFWMESKSMEEEEN